MRAWLWAAVLIVMAAAVGTACGGGGDGDGEAEATPDRPTLEAMLGDISLKLEDLPGSFNVQEEAFTDNEQAAVIDPEGLTKGKERLDGWHRLLGYDASFMTTDPLGAFQAGGIALISESISIFADEQGTAEALQWGRDLLSNPADAASFIPDVSEMEGGPISFPTIGDETTAAEFTGMFRSEEFQVNVPFTAHVVVIRHGRGEAHITVSAIGGAKPGPEVEQLARLVDERMGETLD
jgi:hypothetical protein